MKSNCGPSVFFGTFVIFGRRSVHFGWENCNVSYGVGKWKETCYVRNVKLADKSKVVFVVERRCKSIFGFL